MCTREPEANFKDSFNIFLFAKLIHLRLECRRTNCSVTFSAALHSIDGCPDSHCHNRCRVWQAIVWNSELEIWLINVLLDTFSQYALKGRGKLWRTVPKVGNAEERECHGGIIETLKLYLPNSRNGMWAGIHYLQCSQPMCGVRMHTTTQQSLGDIETK